jgi:hypothetical protein
MLWGRGQGVRVRPINFERMISLIQQFQAEQRMKEIMSMLKEAGDSL